MTTLKIDQSEGTNFGQDDNAVLGTIDFSDWHFAPDEDNELKTALANVVRREMADAFRNTIQSDPPRIEFGSDGINISVSINLGANCNDGWIWFVASIEEMIAEFIEHTHHDQMDGGDEAKVDLAKCLRACAAKLEKAAGEAA